MKYILVIIFLLVFSCLGSHVINVPEDWSTIQEAIDVSIDGDSVLVAPGIYSENINLWGKPIEILSWYSVTQDTSYINSTVIDGGQGGTVVYPYSNCKLSGFVIRNGLSDNGGGIQCWSVTNVELEALIVEYNSASSGGGIYCQNSEINLSGVTIRYNTADESGGGIYSRNDSNVNFSSENLCSIYDNYNTGSNYGNDLFSQSEMSVIVDTFSVSQPTVYYAIPINNYVFSIQHGLHELIVGNIFVSPDGDNANSGICSEQPLRTIHVACSRIMADSLHSGTINLLAGTYSPTANEERFPIELPGYVSLSGESETEVILDAECISRVMNIDYPTQVMNLTMINGEAHSGGCIYCNSGANVYFENVTIRDNFAQQRGGGIFCTGEASLELQNVTVRDNSSNEGGGIYSIQAELEMYDCIVSYNLAIDNEEGRGGGIIILSGSTYLENVLIDNNYSGFNGGGLCCSRDPEYMATGVLQFTDVTLTNNVCLNNGGGLFADNETNIESENLIVEGNYATGNGGGIYCSCSSLNVFTGRILNNIARSGGGLYIDHDTSYPTLCNLLVCDNSAVYNGAGVYLYNNTDICILNSTITNNIADQSGGGIFCHHSVSFYSINNVIWENFPQQLFSYDVGTVNSIMAAYNDIQYGIDGFIINNDDTLEWLEGNIDEEPLFNDPLNGSYLLQQDSPCIDAGIAFYDHYSMILIDLNEDEYFGIAPDMGAYEYGMVDADKPIIPDLSDVEDAKLNIQNYPNPFNPETTITFNIQQPGKVELNVYNVKGQKVRTLIEGTYSSGKHQTVWNGKDDQERQVSSGIYLFKLKAGETMISQSKGLLLK